MNVRWVSICAAVWAATGIHAAEPTPPATPAGDQSGVSADAPATGSLSGVVLETMNAGRYTYLRVKEGDREQWAAGLQTQVAVGDTVQLVGLMPMGRFNSPTLKRTFDDMLFVSEIRVNGKPSADGAAADSVQAAPSGELPPGHPDISGPNAALPAGHPPIEAPDTGTASPEPAAALLTGEVVQTLVGGRYTYVEVKMESGSRWLAAPQVTLQPGQKVTFAQGMEMKDFESSSLGRRFPSIFFVQAVTPVAP